jgi:hypothetical protein
MQPIIQLLPNATLEQIQEFDMLLLQQHQQNENELDSHSTQWLILILSSETTINNWKKLKMKSN